MTDPLAPAVWRLRHAWRSDSDLAVLAACARRLAAHGITLADAASDDEAQAFKRHGFEIVEALRRGTPRFADLGAVAAQQRWAERVDPRAWRFMRQGGAVVGIPVALHRSNVLWTSRRLAEGVGPADGLVAWMRAAARRGGKPLAVGRQPTQIGLLFETLFAESGGEAYRRALVDFEAGALGGDAARHVLAQLSELRALADDRWLDMPWRDALRRAVAEDAGAMVMADWARVSGMPGLVRVEAGPVSGPTVHIADFFVPVTGTTPEVSARVAALLTDAAFQRELAALKGCAPAVTEDAAVAADAESVPSLTFDQCCETATKQAILNVVAEHFLERRPVDESARRLLAVAAAR